MRGLGGLGWTGLQAVFGVGSQLLSMVVVSRLLPPEDFGRFAVAQSLVAIVLVVAQLGFGPAVVRDPTDRARAARAALAASLATSAVGFAFLAICAPVLARGAGLEDADARLVLWLAPTVLLVPMRSVATAWLQSTGRFALLAGVNVGSGLAAIIVTVALALQGQGALALVGGVLVSQLLATAALMGTARIRPRFDIEATRAILSFSGGFVVLQLLDTLINTLDRMLVANLAGASAAGLYQRSVAVRRIGASLCFQPIDAFFYPAIADRLGDATAMRREFERALLIGLWFSLGFTLAVALGAAEWAGFVFGPAWSEVGPMISVMVLCLPFRAVDRVAGVLARVANRQAERAAIMLATLVMLLGSIALLAGRSLPAAVAAVAAVLALSTLLSVRMSSRILGCPTRELAVVCLRPLAFGAVLLLCFGAMERLLLPSLGALAASAIAATCAGAAISVLPFIAPRAFLGRDDVLGAVRLRRRPRR